MKSPLVQDREDGLAAITKVMQYSFAVTSVFVIASLCWLVHDLTGYLFSALVFLFAIVLAGLRWSRGPVLFMAALSGLVWNFFFIPPQLTLHIENPQDVLMFLLFFAVAISMGTLTSRVHERELERERQQVEKEALMLEREQLLEAKHRAEILAESERLHRTLLDSISHELKTPIAIIRTALDGLEPGHRVALEIETATLRLQRIVENFLEMTRIESEVMEAKREWCDLDDVLHTASEALRREGQFHRLVTSGRENLPLLKLDGLLLAQALGNVLHNASIHAPVDSPVELRVSLNGNSLELIVRDHGPGLEAGDELRVFDKFYRACNAPAGGTGLGLAIARGFLLAQGGEIRARNHPDGGAEFIITVPTETYPV